MTSLEKLQREIDLLFDMSVSPQELRDQGIDIEAGTRREEYLSQYVDEHRERIREQKREYMRRKRAAVRRYNEMMRVPDMRNATREAAA